MAKAQPLIVYVPDTRGVTLSPFGRGNYKIGLEVFTFSRVAGNRSRHEKVNPQDPNAVQQVTQGRYGTCPGSTDECESICYAKRIAAEHGVVNGLHVVNSLSDEVPRIPDECRFLRIHVSGDYNSVAYIDNWVRRLQERPDVQAWCYTRSWRVSSLLEALERLRALPNVQLFASMDASCPDLPPAGWRRAWIWRDWNGRGGRPVEKRLTLPTCKRCGDTSEYEGEYGPQACMSCVVGDQRQPEMKNLTAMDNTPAFVCPEETGDKPNCVACGYCISGKKNDVVFLEH